MLIPTVTRGDEVVYKWFASAPRALLELQLSRVLTGSLIECIGNYSHGPRHVLLFERATPLEDVPPSTERGLIAFAGIMRALAMMHNAFGVAHMAVCPHHVVVTDSGTIKLVDTKHIVPLGASLVLQRGMWKEFTGVDALLGGQKVQRRHDCYAAAVTALWAVRRATSFASHEDPLYVLGKSILQRARVDAVRSIWSLEESESILLPHLIGGFEQSVIDALRVRLEERRPPRKRKAAREDSAQLKSLCA